MSAIRRVCVMCTKELGKGQAWMKMGKDGCVMCCVDCTPESYMGDLGLREGEYIMFRCCLRCGDIMVRGIYRAGKQVTEEETICLSCKWAIVVRH